MRNLQSLGWLTLERTVHRRSLENLPHERNVQNQNQPPKKKQTSQSRGSQKTLRRRRSPSLSPLRQDPGTQGSDDVEFLGVLGCSPGSGCDPETPAKVSGR